MVQVLLPSAQRAEGRVQEVIPAVVTVRTGRPLEARHQPRLVVAFAGAQLDLIGHREGREDRDTPECQGAAAHEGRQALQVEGAVVERSGSA